MYIILKHNAGFIDFKLQGEFLHLIENINKIIDSGLNINSFEVNDDRNNNDDGKRRKKCPIL